MSGPQHRTSRCVFVGNIPYDATEEQLVQICEEVGPVVSFRLVLDRDTGKPRGYGFCEFKDEETALSARRNLQGYEINGRQLRVDFAENEKGGGGADRNRDQGRGGPGFQQGAQNTDVLKFGLVGNPQPFGAAAGPGSLEQPIGRAAAAAAQLLMVGALGGSQQMPNTISAQGPLQSLATQAALVSGNGGGVAGPDALTNYLAGMSKSQLYEIMSQMKIMVQQNQQQARQILVSNPQLTKALFQAQIVLGMVRTQQMVQSQQPQTQTAPPTQPANLMAPQARPPVQPQVPPPAQLQSQAPNKANFQGPYAQAPQVQQSQQTSQPLLSQGNYQLPSAMGQTSLGMSFQSVQPPPINQTPPQQMYQVGSNIMPSGINRVGTNNSGGHVGQGSGVGGVHSQSLGGSMASGHLIPVSNPGAALASMGDPNSRSYSAMNSGMNSGFSASMNSGISAGMNQGMSMPGAGAFAGAVDGVTVTSTAMQPQPYSHLQMQAPMASQQSQVPLELEQQKALLQQVLNLTTEQIMSLPPEQRQQVLQLQQALR